MKGTRHSNTYTSLELTDENGLEHDEEYQDLSTAVARKKRCRKFAICTVLLVSLALLSAAFETSKKKKKGVTETGASSQGSGSLEASTDHDDDDDDSGTSVLDSTYGGSLSSAQNDVQDSGLGPKWDKRWKSMDIATLSLVNGTYSDDSLPQYVLTMNDDGTVLAIGDPNWTPSTTAGIRPYVGRAFLFVSETESSTSWTQVAEIHAPYANSMFGDSFAAEVALSGDGLMLAIGIPANRFHPNDLFGDGSVKLYQAVAGSWMNGYEEVLPDIPQVASGDWTGYSVSLNTGLVVVGSPEYYINGNNPGAVRIFRASPGNWTKVGLFMGGSGVSGYGWKVILSDDGHRVISSNQFDVQDFTVYTIDYDGGQWNENAVAFQFSSDEMGCENGFKSLASSRNCTFLAMSVQCIKQNYDDDGSNIDYAIRTMTFKEDAQAKGTWKQFGRTLDRDGDSVSFSVDLSGDGNTLVLTNAGIMEIFRLRDGDWHSVDGEISLGEGLKGKSIALSRNGRRIAAATNYIDRKGRVGVYELRSSFL